MVSLKATLLCGFFALCKSCITHDFCKLYHYVQQHIIWLAGFLSVISLARHAGGVAYLSLRLGNKVQTMPYIPALPSHLPRQMEVLVCANPRIKSLLAKNNIVFANFNTMYNYTWFDSQTPSLWSHSLDMWEGWHISPSVSATKYRQCRIYLHCRATSLVNRGSPNRTE